MGSWGQKVSQPGKDLGHLGPRNCNVRGGFGALKGGREYVHDRELLGPGERKFPVREGCRALGGQNISASGKDLERMGPGVALVRVGCGALGKRKFP